jgi:hypothetical protein
MSYDVIIVGAGPAGTFAARGLEGHRVLVLDVGREPKAKRDVLDRNLYDARSSGADLFEDVIGSSFESLHNVDKNYLSPKLKAPLVRFVSDSWRDYFPVACSGFDPVQSFARGGSPMSGGGGCFRFTDTELGEFPIQLAELSEHYDDLTRHIGISGVEDDLAPWFGTAKACLPALRPSRLGADILLRYQRRRSSFSKLGVHVGLPRMAVLSQEHRGRPSYDYQGLEFFKAHLPSIYNPAFTLQELEDAGRIDYRTPWLVERFRDLDDGVEVEARNVETRELARFRARKLVLAAGTLGTAKIALRSRDDRSTRLPLLDNLISYVPLVGWRHIGRSVEHESLPIQLNVICEMDPREGAPVAPLQASLYGVTATLWNDILFDLPFACRDNIRLLKRLLPAMIVVQLFYPDHARQCNFVQLMGDSTLRLQYEARTLGEVERRLLRAFRRVGFFGSPSLCKYPDPGNSFHYAGCLPMRRDPGPYETAPDGRLGTTRHVYVADAASFPSLPSKNLTFTIMANAQRIGAKLADRLREEV